MHPATSVIFFTVASGAGYGLLFVLAAYAIAGDLPLGAAFGWVSFVLAFALVSGGLLSSFAHLGHPERALMAFSQWRTSWLAREGVLAAATYVPAGLFAVAWLFYPGHLTPAGETEALLFIFAIAAALFAALTVYATSQIYATLEPIRQWNNAYVALGYLAFGLMSGAVLLNALTALLADPQGDMAVLALIALGAGYGVKELYWRHIDNSAPHSTAESATGLGNLGKVRHLDPPHTEENYLQKEMAYRIARKHARRLRHVVRLLGFAAPAAAVAIGWAGPDWLHAALGILAAVLALAGLLVERWLFFAEATHTVTLYYGAPSA